MTLLWNLCDSSGPKCVFIDTDRIFYCSDIKNRVSVTPSRKKYLATEATKILSEWEAIDFADYDSDRERVLVVTQNAQKMKMILRQCC